MIEIVRSTDGTVRLADGTLPPGAVSFSAELVRTLRTDPPPWAHVEVRPTGDHIVMTLADRTLVYRLTGEVDLADGLVAVLIPEGEK